MDNRKESGFGGKIAGPLPSRFSKDYSHFSQTGEGAGVHRRWVQKGYASQISKQVSKGFRLSGSDEGKNEVCESESLRSLEIEDDRSEKGGEGDLCDEPFTTRGCYKENEEHEGDQLESPQQFVEGVFPDLSVCSTIEPEEVVACTLLTMVRPEEVSGCELTIYEEKSKDIFFLGEKKGKEFWKISGCLLQGI